MRLKREEEERKTRAAEAASKAEAARRAAAPAQTQVGHQDPARIELDRRNQVALNGYGQPPKNTPAQNEARPSRTQPGAFAPRTSQVGEGAPMGPEGSSGAIVKTADGAYSVYWPGLRNTQLKYISEEARRLIAQSDTLKQQLRDHGYVQIVYGPTEKGTTYDFNTRTLAIAEIKRDDAKATMGSLAHEAGHIAGPEIDWSSLRSCLNSEGAAQLNRIRIREELLAKGGEDIGIGGRLENQPLYFEIYDQYIAGKITYLEAIARIGDIYGAKEYHSADPTRTYREYYRKRGAK